MVKTMTVGFPADLLVCEGEILVWKLRFERGRWYGGRKEFDFLHVLTNQHLTDDMPGRRNSTKKSGYISNLLLNFLNDAF
ncbi:hypothetical protein NC652_026800 [Populus alba x Populus x berolinensis]|uniref:Uncharacterized protein n=1 Tax=Populus tomentosa TaxID=118781 RepID=A0A8X8AB34_POPTO|nr:hypothetical protein POTOM_051363 [Populus tomentosa]KAG6786083.1 hypothetical protein POTOM_007676 [Populus tomentosa]KAJ6900815.1 hypothetical protein NC652_026800 [Populus alba x Populus x berolinensis]